MLPITEHVYRRYNLVFGFVLAAEATVQASRCVIAKPDGFPLTYSFHTQTV
jgi:hypothetical protein